MKKTVTILLFCFWTGFVQAANWYVDNTAGGTNSGTLANPWTSLASVNWASLSAGDSLLLKRGCTFFEKMTVGKSGSSGNPIIIAAYGSGAKPVISGFSSVTSWTNVSGNIWESTSAIKSSTTMLNMVTINGNFQAIGRWPRFTDANQGYLNIDSHSGNTSITSTGLSGAPSYAGGQIVTKRQHWIIDVDNISSNSGTTVTFTNSDVYSINNNWGFFFQNHSNACTQYGDWYYNTSTRKLGMYATSTPGDVPPAISSIDTLVTVNNFSYITFKNIVITGGNQCNLFITFSRYITIDNCDISYGGRDGITLTDAGADPSNDAFITVSNSTIRYINNNGIIGKEAPNVSITNCVFNNIGMTAGMGGNSDGTYFGISYLGNNATFTGNIMYNIGYTPLYFTGNNSTISNNYIHDYCAVKDDGAGIYTYGNNLSGTVVSSNIVVNGIGNPYGTSNGQNYAEGIYCDDASSNVNINNNTVAYCNRGFYVHNANDITIRANTVYGTAYQVDMEKDNIDPNNIRNIILKSNKFVAKNSGDYVMYYGTTNAENVSAFFTSSDSNILARPINEGTTIRVSDNSFSGTYNLASWRSHTGLDALSKTSIKTISSTDSLLFIYNPNNYDSIFSLQGKTWFGVDSTVYSSGSVTLNAFKSLVLIYRSDITAGGSNTDGMKFKTNGLKFGYYKTENEH